MNIGDVSCRFFCDDATTTEIYTYSHTLSLHDARPCSPRAPPTRTTTKTTTGQRGNPARRAPTPTPSPTARTRNPASTAEQPRLRPWPTRSEEHTTELQSLMRSSYAVFCFKNKNRPTQQQEPDPRLGVEGGKSNQ